MSTFLTYARRGRTGALWWIAAGVCGVVLGFFAAALAQVLAQKLGFSIGQGPLALLETTGVTFAIVLAGFALAVAAIQGKTPADIAGRWNWRFFLAGFVLWGLAGVALSLVDYALVPSGFSLTASASTAALALVAFPAIAVQTLAEEFVFRGFLTQALVLWLRRPLPAAIIAGLLFGSLHIPNGYPQAVAATALGIVFSLIAIRTGGIATTYGMHLVNNLFGTIVVVSDDDVFRGLPGLFTQNTPALMWSDSVLEILALAAVGWLILTRLAPAEPEHPVAGLAS